MILLIVSADWTRRVQRRIGRRDGLDGRFRQAGNHLGSGSQDAKVVRVREPNADPDDLSVVGDGDAGRPAEFHFGEVQLGQPVVGEIVYPGIGRVAGVGQFEAGQLSVDPVASDVGADGDPIAIMLSSPERGQSDRVVARIISPADHLQRYQRDDRFVSADIRVTNHLNQTAGFGRRKLPSAINEYAACVVLNEEYLLLLIGEGDDASKPDRMALHRFLGVERHHLLRGGELACRAGRRDGQSRQYKQEQEPHEGMKRSARGSGHGDEHGVDAGISLALRQLGR